MSGSGNLVPDYRKDGTLWEFVGIAGIARHPSSHLWFYWDPNGDGGAGDWVQFTGGGGGGGGAPVGTYGKWAPGMEPSGWVSDADQDALDAWVRPRAGVADNGLRWYRRDT